MKRVLLFFVVAAIMAALTVISALPALASNTGDANQGPPQASGGFDKSDKAATVLHCGGQSPETEGAIGLEGGTDGTQLGSSGCQSPPRNEHGNPIGHL